MHSLDLPAGSGIRLTATAKAGCGLHRWGVRVIAPGDEATSVRAAYGSAIGERDRDQRVDIPAQDVACTLQVSAHHAVADGWTTDRCSIQDDTPGELRLGFCDAARPGATPEDVVLSFAFIATDRAAGKGQGR